MLRIFFTITPDDDIILPAHEAIYVGGTGTLVVTSRVMDSESGLWVETDTILTAVASGVFHPISAYKIKAASSATGIVGAR